MRRLLARVGAARSMLLWRRPWIAVVAVLVAVALGVLLGAAEGPTRTASTEMQVVAPALPVSRAPVVPAGRALPPRDPDAPAERVGLGERARDGDVDYRVDDLDEVDRVPASSQFGSTDPPITAPRGLRLWRVRITATNRSDESRTVLCAPSADGPAAFLSTAGRFYGPDPRDGVRPQGSDDACDDALPGRSIGSTVLFAVPPDVRPRGIALWDSLEMGDGDGEVSWVLARR